MEESQVAQVQKLKNNVQEIINFLGFGKFQLLIIFYTGLCWIADSIENQVTSLVSRVAHCDFLEQNPDSVTQWLPAATYLGTAMGGYIFGFISDRIGRKKCLLILTVWTSITGLLSAAAHHYVGLIVIRYFTGLGIGGIHVAITMLQEVIQPVTRHVFVAIQLMLFSVGGIIQAGISIGMIPNLGRHGWRYFIIVAAGPMVLASLVNPFVEESPKWLVSQGKFKKAQNVLKKMAKMNGKEIPKELLDSIIPEKAVKGDEIIEEFQVQERKKSFKNKLKYNWVVFKKGLTDFARYVNNDKIVLMTLLIVLYVWFSDGIAYYGSIQIPVSIAPAGKKPFRCDSARHEVIAVQKDFTNIMTLSVAEIPGQLLFIVLLFYLYRKRAYLGLSWGIGLNLVVQAAIVRPDLIHRSWQPKTLTALQYASRAGCAALQQIMYTVTNEVFVASQRSQANGICAFVYRFGAFISPLIVTGMSGKDRATGALALQASFLLSAGILMQFIPVERKGKNMLEEEVQITEAAKIMHKLDHQKSQNGESESQIKAGQNINGGSKVISDNASTNQENSTQAQDVRQNSNFQQKFGKDITKNNSPTNTSGSSNQITDNQAKV